MKKTTTSNLHYIVVCKIALPVIILVASFGQGWSQQPGANDKQLPKAEWGVKVGLNVSTLSVNHTELAKRFGSTTGAAAGLTVAYPAWRMGGAGDICIHTGLEASMKGFTLSNGNNELECRANYIQLPLAVGFRFDSQRKARFEARAGFYFAYGVSGEASLSGSSGSDSTFDDKILKPFDAGMIIGGFCYLNKFVFGIHGEMGLMEPNADNFTITGATGRMGNTSFTVGYLF